MTFRHEAWSFISFLPNIADCHMISWIFDDLAF